MLPRKHEPPLTKIVRPSQNSLFSWFSEILYQNIVSFLGLVFGVCGFYFMGSECIALISFGAYSMKHSQVWTKVLGTEKSILDSKGLQNLKY